MIRQLNMVVAVYPLPSWLKFYDVDDQVVFEVRETGLKGWFHKLLGKRLYIAYLTTKWKGQFYRYGIEFDDSTLMSTARRKIDKAIHLFEKALEENAAKTYNPDGGDLGRA